MGLSNIYVQNGDPEGSTSPVCTLDTSMRGSVPIETEVDALFSGAAVLELTAGIGDSYFVSSVITDAIAFFFGVVTCFSEESEPPSSLGVYVRVSDEYESYPPVTFNLGTVNLLDSAMNLGTTTRVYESLKFKLPLFENEETGVRSRYQFFFKLPSAAAAALAMTVVVHGAHIVEP